MAKPGDLSVDPATHYSRVTARCLGALVIGDAPVELHSDPEKMSYLAALGFSTDDIATILQVALKTVQNRLGERRKVKRSIQ